MQISFHYLVFLLQLGRVGGLILCHGSATCTSCSLACCNAMAAIPGTAFDRDANGVLSTVQAFCGRGRRVIVQLSGVLAEVQ